jgi:hypothetical protein
MNEYIFMWDIFLVCGTTFHVHGQRWHTWATCACAAICLLLRILQRPATAFIAAKRATFFRKYIDRDYYQLICTTCGPRGVGRQSFMSWKKPKAQLNPHLLCIISGTKFSNNISEVDGGSPTSCPNIA